MLTVHKNTRARRAAKNVRKSLMQDAKQISQTPDIIGYSIVAWDKNYGANCKWHSSPPTMPGVVVPEFTKQVLHREINQNDTNYIIDKRFFD